LLAELENKAKRLPIVAGREVVTSLWLKSAAAGIPAERMVTPRQVFDVLR
jgi:hypothetical protein